ncbi:MAG: hypothetical protein IPO21_18355 [Bacteroidales bacterium]|nr:hypothetical protein [Bacteroidales bacterium]
MRKVAIFIMILGVGLTIFSATTFFTKEKVVDIGKIEISKDKPFHLSWSPYIGLSVIAIGGVIFGLTYYKN